MNMKLALHDNEFETNVETKTQNFVVGNISKLIKMLRNLYQYKARTAVQEYMSNARDAMREAGSTKRIIVTVPNQLNPVFKVRDFGPGITPHRMENVFIAYGGTTKDTTNGQTGGFGIGAKSAWAYTDSFTIVSITGGKKRTYVAHLGKTEQGSVDLISTEPTTEETGTEIQIAVKNGDIQEFRNAIWRSCHFWTADEYPEFKGVLPTDVPQRKSIVRVGDLELIGTNDLPNYLGLDSNHYQDYLSVVIDGIPYKQDKPFLQSVEHVKRLLTVVKCNLVIHVGNGVLEFPPTRESIDVSELNRDVLNKIAEKLMIGLSKHIGSEFKKASTSQEWVKAYADLSKILNVDSYSKRGDYYIEGGVLFSDKFEKVNLLQAGPNWGRRAKGNNIKREEEGGIPLEFLSHMFYLDQANETIVTQNRRISEYCTKGAKRIVLFNAAEQYEMKDQAQLPAFLGPDGKKTYPPPVPPVRTVVVTLKDSQKALAKIVFDLGCVALSTLPYTMPVREPRETRVKEEQEFTVHNFGAYRKHPRPRTLAKVEKQKEKYLYVKYGEYEKYALEFGDMSEFLDSMGWGLCALSPGSIRTVSGSKHFQTYDSWKAAFKPDAKIVAGICAERAKNKLSMELLSDATTKIKDKALVKMVEAYQPILKNGVRAVPKTIERMVSKEVKEFTDSDSELTKLLRDSYPLISRVTGKGEMAANELVIYINAKV
jgi:hypothetical protein